MSNGFRWNSGEAVFVAVFVTIFMTVSVCCFTILIQAFRKVALSKSYVGVQILIQSSSMGAEVTIYLLQVSVWLLWYKKSQN
jgi:hypothetical protein